MLKLVAKRLIDCTKSTDKILRLGGDEFAILCQSFMSREDSEALARRIISRIEEPFSLDGQHISISVSIGILGSDEPLTEFDALLRQADEAMYAAKRAGRGQYCFHEN